MAAGPGEVGREVAAEEVGEEARRKESRTRAEEVAAVEEAPLLEWRRGLAAVEAGGCLGWAGEAAGPTCPTGRGVAEVAQRRVPWMGEAAAGRPVPGMAEVGAGLRCGGVVVEGAHLWMEEEGGLQSRTTKNIQLSLQQTRQLVLITFLNLQNPVMHVLV